MTTSSLSRRIAELREEALDLQHDAEIEYRAARAAPRFLLQERAERSSLLARMTTELYHQALADLHDQAAKFERKVATSSTPSPTDSVTR